MTTTTGPSAVAPDGVVLSTVVVGDPGRERILLQHGVGSSVTFLVEQVAPPLVRAGWCVVAAELRGHGGAAPVREASAHTLQHHVGDVAALADAVRPAVVGGVSLGSHAAAMAAATGAVRCDAVLAILPAAVGAVDALGPHGAVAAEVETHGVAGMVDRLRHEDALRPWLSRVLLRDLVEGDRASVEAALCALPGSRAPTLEELVGLPVPLAVVGWPDDPGHPLGVARAWARAAARSALATLDLAELDDDPAALGAAAADALPAALGQL